MCGSTRLSIANVKHVVFPLPLCACRPFQQSHKGSFSWRQRHNNDRLVGGQSKKMLQKTCTCAMRLLKGGWRIMGNVVACILDGFSNFISV